MKPAYLLIGGNIGDRLVFLGEACRKMEQNGIAITRKSSIYETAAWGKTDQSAFLNQVLEIETGLTPTDLLKEILAIELSMGRKRMEKNGARTIDIDILYYGEEKIQLPGLTIPHERISLRRFVLVPMAELSPLLFDPFTEKTIQEMLETCADNLEVRLFQKT
jgi:2-amino-4-hydroxy-6-hydroxymethyldihydropteridine diphosphokinase